MNRAFIVSQRNQQQADAISDGISVATLLGKQAEVFAYSYESFAGEQDYYPQYTTLAKQHILKQRRVEVEELLLAANASDVPVQYIWTKDLYEHACEYSASHGFDLMVKSIHQSERLLPMDWQLIRHINIPLLLLSSNPLKKANTVLMAVDLGSDSEEKQRLNDRVIQHAKELAEAINTQLHLVYVVRVPQILRDLDLVSTHELIKEAYQRYGTQLADIGLPRECVHIMAGDAELCIFELSCRIKADYVVMGTHQRRGLMGFVIGNTAEAILDRIRSNILIIPNGDKPAE